ncbi:hypothetical protein EOK75_01070 [Pseudorhodobacter turbinis]|uniref:Uncharacterized protein n=1 Tax=Pseudorhodobacter turbinis TaxID=2500533 RepID=A0A4V1E0G3_9RHOB|nr:hypothetical protein EOK75_01070 [Pseudorhodobacter turbinis]
MVWLPYMGADIPESTLFGGCGRAMKTLSPLIERVEVDIRRVTVLADPWHSGPAARPALR